MSFRDTLRTEHSGAKNGGGHWGKRAEAKDLSRAARRAADKRAERTPVIRRDATGPISPVL